MKYDIYYKVFGTNELIKGPLTYHSDLVPYESRFSYGDPNRDPNDPNSEKTYDLVFTSRDSSIFLPKKEVHGVDGVDITKWYIAEGEPSTGHYAYFSPFLLSEQTFIVDSNLLEFDPSNETTDHDITVSAAEKYGEPFINEYADNEGLHIVPCQNVFKNFLIFFPTSNSISFSDPTQLIKSKPLKRTHAHNQVRVGAQSRDYLCRQGQDYLGLAIYGPVSLTQGEIIPELTWEDFSIPETHPEHNGIRWQSKVSLWEWPVVIPDASMIAKLDDTACTKTKAMLENQALKISKTLLTISKTRSISSKTSKSRRKK